MSNEGKKIAKVEVFLTGDGRVEYRPAIIDDSEPKATMALVVMMDAIERRMLALRKENPSTYNN